ncbi:MAG: type III-B CRISPR module RAMP protein Cmr1 [bacterium]|jgi:CRISPR-associated protein Cmr1
MLQAKIELLTPAFAGGADNRNTAEIRASAIRGGLRFWARALLGYLYGSDSNGLENAKTIETRIFGDTSIASNAALRVEHDCSSTKKDVGGKKFIADSLTKVSGFDSSHRNRLKIVSPRSGSETPSNMLGWLGYGCVGFKGDAQKFYFPSGCNLNLIISSRVGSAGLNEKEMKLLEASLWCYVTFGGLGSRSRRGWGSMIFAKCSELNIVSARNVNKPNDGLQEILPKLSSAFNVQPRLGFPNYSHFAKGHTRILKAKSANVQFGSPLDALDFAGCLLVAFRRRYGIQLENRILYGTKRDYQWAKNRNVGNVELPGRIGFGLPLPFGRFNDEIVSISENANTGDRRASPLLVAVKKSDDGSYYPVFLYLKSRFLPQGVKLKWKRRNFSAPEQSQIVDDFLNFYSGNGRLVDITPEVLI